MPQDKAWHCTLFPTVLASIVIAADVSVMPACLASENNGHGVLGLVKDSTVGKEQDWALVSGKAYTTGQIPRTTLEDTLQADVYSDDILEGRHPYLALILNNRREPVCGGIVIRGNYVLTAHHCTWGVGPNALVALGATGIYENGTVMAAKVVRAEETHHHPLHPLQGTDPTVDQTAVDISLLKVNVDGVLTPNDVAPTADPDYDRAFNGMMVFTFHLEPMIGAKRRSIQVVSFSVGHTEPCRTMSEPGPHILCITSNCAGMPRGSSGFPILYMDIWGSPDKALSDPLQFGTPNTDLILGVVSFDVDKAENMDLGLHAIGATKMMKVVCWINRITAPGNVPHSSCQVANEEQIPHQQCNSTLTEYQRTVQAHLSFITQILNLVAAIACVATCVMMLRVFWKTMAAAERKGLSTWAPNHTHHQHSA